MDTIAVCGRSRIGKSTFLKHLFGLSNNDIKSAAGDKVVTQGIDQVIRKVQLSEIKDMSVNPQEKVYHMATVLDCQGLSSQ